MQLRLRFHGTSAKSAEYRVAGNSFAALRAERQRLRRLICRLTDSAIRRFGLLRGLLICTRLLNGRLRTRRCLNGRLRTRRCLNGRLRTRRCLNGRLNGCGCAAGSCRLLRISGCGIAQKGVNVKLHRLAGSFENVVCVSGHLCGMALVARAERLNYRVSQVDGRAVLIRHKVDRACAAVHIVPEREIQAEGY